MKKNNLVPKNNSSTQEIILPINHEKLSAALRNDMRQAAEYLLPIHKAIGELPTTGLPEEWSEELLEWLEGIGAALEALDCIEHIPVMNDENRIENSLEALEEEKVRLAQARNEAAKRYKQDLYLKLTTQFSDLAHEIGRRQDAHDDILENLVQDAIESGDTAVLKHDESELFCDVCGGFSGCACEGGNDA